jgi:hypothetical protein
MTDWFKYDDLNRSYRAQKRAEGILKAGLCEHNHGKKVEGNLIRCADPTCNKVVGFVRKPKVGGQD